MAPNINLNSQTGKIEYICYPFLNILNFPCADIHYFLKEQNDHPKLSNYLFLRTDIDFINRCRLFFKAQ